MKTKVASFCFALLLSLGANVQAGPGVAVSVGTRPAITPAPICRPPIYRSYPVSCAIPQPAFYSWGPSVVVYSPGPSSGFTTVSPVMNYGGNPTVYRVPDPIVTAQPVVVYPTSNFGWKK